MEALMIGVSGMRGTVGGSLTPAVVARMAGAFARWLIATQSPVAGPCFRVVFGRDGRASGYWVRDAASAALQAAGIEVIDLDVVTTPGVAMMLKHISADGGMIATASHNPIQWNGLKLLTRNAVAPPPAAMKQIQHFYEENMPPLVRVEQLVSPSRNTETHALHVRRVLEHVDVLGISTKRYKVVLDSVNGAGSVATATLLNKLGCQLRHINATPNGQFPHEPEPTEKNLVGLVEAVRRERAQVGFAQDPDADRLAIVDENGRYIGEEYSLALAARWMLGNRPGVAVTNLSTSRMIDDIAVKTGSRVLRTPVGEANVIDVMLRENAVVGGEGNGGVIDPRIVPGRNSLVGIAYVLQLMASTGKTISQLVDEMPRYYIVKTKFDCARDRATRAILLLQSAFASQRLDTQDGLRIDWEAERTWAHVRPSNTEPIVRIIAESPSLELVEGKIAELRKAIDQALLAN